MGKSSNPYYTLRYERSGHQLGRSLRFAGREGTISIGQREGCDFRIENRGEFEDEIFAVIRQDETGGGWILIPVSEYVAISVNRTKVGLACRLSDGDLITFDDDDVRFNVRNDGKYDMGTTSSRHPAMWEIVLAAVVVAYMVCLTLHLGRREGVIREELVGLREYVLRISVDTVFYLRACTGGGVDTIGCYSYVASTGKERAGTAFWSEKGLVTARHCIQPWLNTSAIRSVQYPEDLQEGDPVRWAFEAETYNYVNENADSLYSLVSVCTLWGGETGTTSYGRYLSSEFRINTTYDDIVPMGGKKRACYWRSIVRRNNQTEMMLGDVAVLDTALVGSEDEGRIHPTGLKSKGGIRIATPETMKDLSQGTRLYCLGYPHFQSGGYTFMDCTLAKGFEEGLPLSINCELQPGYSGGPVVIAKDTGGSVRVSVVGVVSVGDSFGGDRVYSVPVDALPSEG